jgi:O-antigen/teichoic acid export membrane protein
VAQLSRREWFGNFSRLLAGNSAGQVLALLLYPSIARLYGPAEFAAFGFVTSLAVFLSQLGTGQFHSAVLRPRDAESAGALLGSSLACLALLTGLLAAVTAWRGDHLAALAPYVFLLGMFEIQKSALLRLQDFKRISAAVFGFRLGGNALKLAPVLAIRGTTGLVVSEVAALAVVVALNLRQLVRLLRWDARVLREYGTFAVLQTGNILLLLLLADLPILFWRERFSPTDIGHFVMGQKLILVPVIVVGQAVYNATIHGLLAATFPRAAYQRSAAILLTGGAILALLCYAFSASLAGVILGRTWDGGQDVFQILAISCLTKPVASLAQGIFIQAKRSFWPFALRLTQLLVLVLSSGSDFTSALWTFILLDLTVDLVLVAAAWAKIDTFWRERGSGES